MYSQQAPEIQIPPPPPAIPLKHPGLKYCDIRDWQNSHLIPKSSGSVSTSVLCIAASVFKRESSPSVFKCHRGHECWVGKNLQCSKGKWMIIVLQFSSPHQPNHLEKGKEKAFWQCADDPSRSKAPNISPLPERQRLLIMEDCHSKPCKGENLLLRLEEGFIFSFSFPNFRAKHLLDILGIESLES